MKLLKSLCLIQGLIACDINVGSRDECQAKCDEVDECGAWSYHRQKRVCHTKGRYGWTAKPNDPYDSGFKNAGPWYEPKTSFAGGDLEC